MVLDYWVDIPCEPRRRFGVEGLLERLRRLGDPARDVHGVRAGARAVAPTSGVRAVPASLSTALEAGFELRPVAFHCSHCPANHQRRAYGCYSSVNFPLSLEAEAWLMGLFPTGRCPAGVDAEVHRRQLELAKALSLELSELTPREGAERRRSRRACFEGGRPLARVYGRWPRRVRVTADDLVHHLFHSPPLPPDRAELTCRALGVWVDGDATPSGTIEAVFTEPASLADDTCILELKQYFLALMVACSLGVEVHSRTLDPGR